MRSAGPLPTQALKVKFIAPLPSPPPLLSSPLLSSPLLSSPLLSSPLLSSPLLSSPLLSSPPLPRLCFSHALSETAGAAKQEQGEDLSRSARASDLSSCSARRTSKKRRQQAWGCQPPSTSRKRRAGKERRKVPLCVLEDCWTNFCT
eukprot:765897-Hanusia_phi.AAC.1